MHARRLTFVCVLLLVIQPVLLAQSPWFGTWKLNRQKSTMTGDTFTITESDGKYRMDNGVITYDLKDDGEDYPMMPSRTVSLKKTGGNTWLQVMKHDGKETSRTILTISADGGTMTTHKTGTHADGSAYVEDATDQRVGAGVGLAGTWKSLTQSDSVPELLVYSDAGHGAMKMVSPESQSTITTRFDGKPAPDVGPHATPGEELSIQATSPTSYTWVLAMNGKPFVEGSNKIAADGKSFTEVNWLISKPAEKYTVVYDRK